jgi:hypothetical protein
MPNTTVPRGLPYPLPSEPVAEGAVAIRNLAEAIDPKLGLVKIDDYVAVGSVDPYDTDVRLGVNAIPQTFKDLLLVAVGNQDSASAQQIQMTLNGITGAGYFWQSTYAQQATQFASEGVNTGQADVGYAGSSAGMGFYLEILFPYYVVGGGGAANMRFWRSNFYAGLNNSANNQRIGHSGGCLGSAGAIRRIVLGVASTPAFQTGTHFTLYGRN